MNEALRNFWTQARGKWAGLPARSRRNLMIAAAALLAALVVVLFAATRPHYVTIMEGLDDKSLGQVQQELDTLKIPNEIQGTAVLVPARYADEARIQLSMAGLPQNGYDAYSGITTSLGETQDEFNLQVLNALQQSLSATISNINGVESAQVHIVMPQQQLFVTQPTTDAKASVFVTLGPGVQLSSAQVFGIQQLVAHSVPGLNVGNVTVVDQYGNVLSSDVSTGGSSTGVGAASSELAMREKLENDLQQTLIAGLQQIVGAQNAVVVVHANVTFNQTATTTHTLLNAPGSNAGFVTSQQVQKSQSTSGAPGGAAGQAGSNPNLNSTYAAAGGGATNSTSSNTITNYAYSYQNQQTTADPMQVLGYSVGVLLNSNDKNITPAVEAQIRNFVQAVLGSTPSQGKNIVSVSAVPFANTLQAVPAAPGVKTWVYALGGLVLGGLVVAGFLFFRRRRQPAGEIIEIPAGEAFEPQLEELPLTEEEVLRNQLVHLAQHRPDDFASLLRTWLSE
ncbi:flagellar basal-body MS-ring/collar protein FliF [Alicyclobacillus vulcanalis]|uniref:Flagellar M-ring protein n=1 Tax=Alicyclobacillus vulcanalis TaxID=252246 RepID=A0A1N7MX74_9BACL|nr:flagellar basal-body MS-ring/collar protein FliF [Alicyclobacillus vulcanalis]SIS90682.1 flagellar M-ring protein FliF [Alicyclobacillus vulcanalis]